MFRSLAFKWIATLIPTSLIGVILVGFFAYRSTQTQFDRLRFEQALSIYVDNVTAYYLETGSWEGLATWLRETGTLTRGPRVFIPMQQFALVDTNGKVVVEHGPFHMGDQVAETVLAQGIPILINDRRIATALEAMPPPDLDPREQRYIERAMQALLLGALGASATAILIGLFMSRQFLRPLSALTRAITAMHQGDLDQRVEIHSRDELGILAQTFNEMSANLHRANQLRKQMTADIAHELRTPLTVVAGYLEALRDGTLKPTTERFRMMSEEVSLLHRLVEDLRTLSLADAGELRLVRGQVSAPELLERVARSFAEAAHAAGITLEVERTSGPALPPIPVDAERMVQVIGNLVSNALRHTARGGLVRLRATLAADGQALDLSVRDTGSGIAPDDLPKIFDRFYRADPSRETSGAESGLGLAIAKSIVEAHGGTIQAESVLAVGTTVIIRLPMLHPTGIAHVPAPPRPS